MVIKIYESSSNEPEHISMNGRTLTIVYKSGDSFNKITFKCEEEISVDIYTKEMKMIRTNTNVIPYPETCLTLDEVNKKCKDSCPCCNDNLDSYHSLSALIHSDVHLYYIFIVISGVYVRDMRRSSNESFDREKIFSDEHFIPFTMTKSARSIV